MKLNFNLQFLNINSYFFRVYQLSIEYFFLVLNNEMHSRDALEVQM